eukprot:6613810-Pyramimonas_sp.AAC.1
MGGSGGCARSRTLTCLKRGVDVRREPRAKRLVDRLEGGRQEVQLARQILQPVMVELVVAGLDWLVGSHEH